MANHLSTYDRTQKKVFELLRQVEDYDALPTDVKNKCLSAIDKAVAYKCRTDFFAFVRAVSPFIIDGFEPGRHIEIICKELQELAHSIWRNTGHAKRVQISMCPGGSKSHICTRLFPAWVIGNWPNARIMLVGHSIDFARDEFSAKVRDIVWLDQYQKIFPGTILREDKTSAGRFLTTKRGEVQAASLDGKVAGRRAHLIINDDSLVEEDALSKTICKQKVQRYMPNIRSRLLTRPDCAELLVGCLVGDTKILMDDNTVKNIKDMKQGDKIQTWNQDKMEIKEVSKAWSVGEDDVYTVFSKNADPITGNARHPFLLDTGEWIQLSDLRVGDNLVLRGKQSDKVVSEQKDLDFMYLLGFMMGDGWVNTSIRKSGPQKGAKRFVTCVATSIYPKLNQHIQNLFKNLFDVDLRNTRFGYKRTDVKKVATRFREAGFEGNAHTKRIPEYVFSLPEDQRLRFLEGLIDADGNEVYTLSGKHTAFGMELCNKLLVADTKRLAQGLGFTVGKVRERHRTLQPPNSPKPVESSQYSITISNISRKMDEFITTPITEIAKHDEKQEVFDLEVEGNHNFIANNIVVHNTRWVIGDLFDYLEKEDKRSGSPWKVLKIPALLTTEASKLLRRPGDPDGYLTPGTSFWPEFQPTTKLESIRSSFQNNISRWNAVYQQNPTPQDGSLVSPEWFSHWRESELPQFKSIWVTADTAYTKGTQSDFTAIQVWGIFNHTSQQGGGVQVTRPNCMLIEHEKGKWEFPELIDKFQDYREKYDPDGIIIEDRSSGLALIPDLIKRGFPIKPWKTSADKVARMQTTAPFLRSGRFWVQMPREDEALIQKSFDWVGEICMFPDGPHDDEADALTQFVLFMRDENKLTDVGYTREEDWEDYEDDDDVAGVTRITNYASSLM